jgi:fructuronate reductase
MDLDGGPGAEGDGVKKPVLLSERTLDQLPPEVAVPRYRRRDVRPRIAHLGVGGFHRAHMEVYTDDLLQAGVGDWGISGVGLVPADRGMKEALQPQDHLYTVVARSARHREVRVIGSLVDYLLAEEGREQVLERLALEQTRIVSLTITENGYRYRPATGELDGEDPEVRHDLADPGNPRTAVGVLAEALRRRRDSGLPSFTILSCDNLPGNGQMLRRLLLDYCRQVDGELHAWIEETTALPNTMVDRITPFTTQENRAFLEGELGIHDNWPVFCEDFRQWIIEDHFPAGRPEWDQAGARFVPNVHPYELMKIRLLNGSHSTLGYLGYLLGFRDVDLAMADPDLRLFLRESYMEEVTPTLQPVPGIDLSSYKDELVRRFSNPAIKDQMLRLAMDGSKKIPNMIARPLAETIRAGRSHRSIALSIAGWMRFLTGSDEQGQPIPIEDPLGTKLTEAARKSLRPGAIDPRPFLALGEIFGDEIPRSAAFVATLTHWLNRLSAKGARSTLQAFLRGE